MKLYPINRIKSRPLRRVMVVIHFAPVLLFAVAVGAQRAWEVAVEFAEISRRSWR